MIFLDKENIFFLNLGFKWRNYSSYDSLPHTLEPGNKDQSNIFIISKHSRQHHQHRHQQCILKHCTLNSNESLTWFKISSDAYNLVWWTEQMYINKWYIFFALIFHLHFVIDFASFYPLYCLSQLLKLCLKLFNQKLHFWSYISKALFFKKCFFHLMNTKLRR